MSKASIEIQLDKPDRTYAPGESISGTAIVRATQECTCREVVLSYRWQTHGRGNRARGSPITMTLATEESLIPGLPYRYPFKFQAPSGPATYHGHYLNLDWAIHVVAELQRGLGSLLVRNPKQETEILLQPAQSPLQVRSARDAGPISPVRAYVALLGLVLGCIMGIAAIFVSRIGPSWVAISLLAMAVSGYFFVRFWPEIELGTVDVKVSSLGQEIRCQVRFSPIFRINLEEVTATLNVQEVCVAGSGSNQETFRHTLFEQSRTKSYGQVLEPRQEFLAELPLAVQPDLPSSLEVRSNKIEWVLRLEIRPGGAAVWRRAIPLVAHR